MLWEEKGANLHGGNNKSCILLMATRRDDFDNLKDYLFICSIIFAGKIWEWFWLVETAISVILKESRN